MNIVVTGASGFIGTNLCPRLAAAGHRVRRAVRSSRAVDGPGVVVVGEIGPTTMWDAALNDTDVVVHLAGMAHRPLSRAGAVRRLRDVNVAGTARLAEQAAARGVKRLVYLSSAKVHGEQTYGLPYNESQQPLPKDHYGISKLEAEEELFGIADRTGLEISVIRPALVYGPRVKGNLLRLLRWIDKGFPVPVPKLPNRRSMIGVNNLASLIACCVSDRKAAGEVFLAADGEDLSSDELVRRLARSLGRPARTVRLPMPLALAVANRLGGEDVVARLLGSLQVDASKARRVLNWRAMTAVDDGLADMVAWYRSDYGNGAGAV